MAAPDPPFPAVAEGTLLFYRFFDLAEGIDLARAEAMLAGSAARLRLAGERQGFLDLPDRPLTIDLGPREVALEDGTALRGTAFVRLFSMGAAGVRYEVPIPAGAGPEVLSGRIRSAADSAALEGAARAEAEALRRRLAPALDGSHSSPLFETYAIVFARGLRGGDAGAVDGPDLARVLLGEPPGTVLSPRTVADVTRRRFSYEADDLCVLDWDAAFVVEPSGDRSIPDVLELASAQLLELRWYDDLFERELLEVAGVLGRPPGLRALLGLRRARSLALRLQHRVLDSVEFVARVENAVRVVGDLYLARVYRGALERLRVDEWKGGVLRHQGVAASVAALLHDEAHSALGHLLEFTIVLLIVLEIVLAFGK
jgi:hypothetical protein